MNPSQSYLLQMQALREALERSARATLLAEEHTVRAVSDLQFERNRARELEKEVSRLTQRYATLLSENRRLRNLVGEACQDRNSLSAEMELLLKELQEPSPNHRLDEPRLEQRRDAAKFRTTDDTDADRLAMGSKRDAPVTSKGGIRVLRGFLASVKGP